MAFTSSFSLDTASLISTVLEGILYGFSVLMFIGTMWAMTYKRSMRDVNRPVAAAAVLLSVLSTAHMVVRIIRIEYGLVTYQGVPAAYFADVSQDTYVIKNSIYVLQTLLGDAVAIYRCYVVWQAAWVIILPSLLWCCVAGWVTVILGVACSNIALKSPGALSVYGDSQTSSNGIISTKVNVECMGAFCGLTLAANLTSSGITCVSHLENRAQCLFLSHFKGPDHEYNTCNNGFCYFVHHSAPRYSNWIPLFGHWTVYSDRHASRRSFSIAFYMIIIRIAIGQNTHTQILTVRGAMTSETERGSSSQYSMKPLKVDISRSTHTDSTSVYKTSSWDQSGPPTGKESLVLGDNLRSV
ncbi:hypothetical protein F4604DRAFT_983683 [Suillus subluteus]|nr:hypothetical protein F4604DRAFT_983683 [Suillus subluteus]